MTVTAFPANFDIAVTTEPGMILIVNGTVDAGATLDACTLRARDTLNGYSLTFRADDGNTEIETPDPYPNAFIVPR